MKLLVTTLLLLTAACRDGDEMRAVGANANDIARPWGHESDPALAPVTDPKARTVKELFAAGFLIVDQHETACPAGPGVVCDGFDAVYLGKEVGPGTAGPAAFACPGSNGPLDSWKCRVLDPPYMPNGGLKPLIANGS